MKKSVYSAFCAYLFLLWIPNVTLAEKPIIYAQSGNNSPVYYALFSHDTEYLASFSISRAVIWEVDSGRSYGEFHIEAAVPAALVKSFGFKTFEEGSVLARSKKMRTDSGKVVYSTDAKLVAEIPNSNAASILIKEVKSGKVLKTLGFIRDSIRRVSISEDETALYCGSVVSGLLIWDARGALKNKAQMAALLEDGRFIAEAGYKTVGKFFSKEKKGFFSITDTLTGRAMNIPMDQLPEDSRIFAVSPDMDKVLVGVFGERRLYQVLAAATLKPLLTIPPPGGRQSPGWHMGGFAFSPDGTHIALLAEELDTNQQKRKDAVYVYNIHSGEQISRLTTDHGSLSGFRYTPSGDGLFIAEAYVIHLVNVKTGAILKTFATGNEKARWRVSLRSNIYVSSDTRWLAMGDANGVVHLWDVNSGKKINTFTGQGDGTSFVLFTPDKERMWSTGTDDGTVRLTDVSAGKEIASFISFRDGEWLVITSEGYHNAAPKGEKHLNVRLGNKISGIEKYRKEFYRPDKVKGMLQGGGRR
ncbi:MAG: WD40 repeat domain-containing protein [Deltaproteobacteria bacterium]|nr:WD40 repeat domain-containing protein [Deltaproteobacteria bacterium]